MDSDFYAKLINPVPYVSDLMESKNSTVSFGIPWVKAVKGLNDTAVSKSMSITLGRADRSHDSKKNMS